jgi:ribosomal protein S18 acetylase RimI-like enzyme
MIIEQAKVEDADEILALQKLAYQSEAELYGNSTIQPLTQTLTEMQAEFAKRVFLKASLDGAVIGSVRAHVDRETCFIGKLIVHPRFQNQGIGTRLMNEIEKRFVQVERYELFTGHKSERNLHLYRKLGYKSFRSQKITDALTLVYMEKRSCAE